MMMKMITRNYKVLLLVQLSLKNQILNGTMSVAQKAQKKVYAKLLSCQLNFHNCFKDLVNHGVVFYFTGPRVLVKVSLQKHVQQNAIAHFSQSVPLTLSANGKVNQNVSLRICLSQPEKENQVLFSLMRSTHFAANVLKEKTNPQDVLKLSFLYKWTVWAMTKKEFWLWEPLTLLGNQTMRSDVVSKNVFIFIFQINRLVLECLN